MMWNGDGTWVWWWPGLLLMIVCMVMMVRMMGHRSQGAHAGEQHGHRPRGSERILAERLARGEIDIEDYERRLAALQQADEIGER
jgi:putative membrane protein